VYIIYDCICDSKTLQQSCSLHVEHRLSYTFWTANTNTFDICLTVHFWHYSIVRFSEMNFWEGRRIWFLSAKQLCLLLYVTLCRVLSAAVAGDAEYEDLGNRCRYFIKRCPAADTRRENSLQQSDRYGGIQVLSQWALSCTHRQRGKLQNTWRCVTVF